MTETTNEDKAQSHEADNNELLDKERFRRKFTRNLIDSFADTVFSSAILIVGSLVVLKCLDSFLSSGKDITAIFNEAIGELTLLVVPFLLCFALGCYLFVSLFKWNWAKERLFNLMSGLQNLITSIVGLMAVKMIYFTHKFPHCSVLIIGVVSILLVALFSTIEEEFKAGKVKEVGGFTFFTLGIFLLLICTAV